MENNQNNMNGQSNGMNGQNVYGQANGMNEQNVYGQSNGMNGQNVYGQANGMNEQNVYGQPYGMNGQNVYGQPNGMNMYGQGNMPMGDNGKPLKNHFGLKLTLSILQIISCNLLSLICGIIACVNTVKANNSFKQGRWEAFKSSAKAATLSLWIGLAGFIIGTFLLVFMVGSNMDSFWEGYYGAYYDVQGTPTSTTAPGYAVAVDDVAVYLPCDFEDLEYAGFEIGDASVASTKMRPHEIKLVPINNSYGSHVMWAWVENQSTEKAYPDECVVIGANVDTGCYSAEYFYTYDNLDFYSTLTDCIAMMGDYDDWSTSDDLTTYYWYFEKGSGNVWQVIEITFFDDGYIYEYDVTYR